MINSDTLCKHCGKPKGDHCSPHADPFMANKCPGDATKYTLFSMEYWNQLDTYFEPYKNAVLIDTSYNPITICKHCGKSAGMHRSGNSGCPPGDFYYEVKYEGRYWDIRKTSFEPLLNLNMHTIVHFCKHCSSHNEEHSTLNRCPAKRLFPGIDDLDAAEDFWKERGTSFEAKDVPMVEYQNDEICCHCKKSFGEHHIISNRCPDKIVKRDDILVRISEDTCFSLDSPTNKIFTQNEETTKDALIINPTAGVDGLVHMQYYNKQEEILKLWGLTYKGNDKWLIPEDKNIAIDKIDVDTWLLKLGFNSIFRVWTKG